MSVVVLLFATTASAAQLRAGGGRGRYDRVEHGSVGCLLQQVLPFEKVSDVEVDGRRLRASGRHFRSADARGYGLRLGSESLVLTQFLASKGRAFPADSRSNDRWFQHIAIVVSDMDRAYSRLREYQVEYASTGPQTLPAWNLAAGGIRAFYFRDPDEHYLELIQFPAGKGDPRWQSQRLGCFWELITARSWSTTPPGASPSTGSARLSRRRRK